MPGAGRATAGNDGIVSVTGRPLGAETADHNVSTEAADLEIVSVAAREDWAGPPSRKDGRVIPWTSQESHQSSKIRVIRRNDAGR